MVEPDENDRLVAKPFNVNEVNKQKQQQMEEEPAQSLVTASILAQQKARTSNEGPQNVMANSISAGNDISPSFQNTSVTGTKAAPDGGPMTFEPNSFAGKAMTQEMSFH